MSDDDRLLDQFEENEFRRPYFSVVYGFYDQREDEWLYVGQGKDAISRLDNHLNTHSGTNLLRKIEIDDNRDMYVDAKTYIRRHVRLKYVEIPEDDKRNKVERQLINKLNPLYNKQ